VTKLPNVSRRKWWSLSRSDRRELVRFANQIANRHRCNDECCCCCGDYMNAHGSYDGGHTAVCMVTYYRES
jgi:hypothetical protein